MSELNKGHSIMGLPRASGKRRWSGEEGADAVPSKVICTSPPHALCAEDILHHPALTHAHASTPALECELTSTTVEPDSSEVSSTDLLSEEQNESSSSSTIPGSIIAHEDTTTNAFTDSEDESMDDDHDDFIDDEEDKDSGFIDSNSIDNSSDDEVDSSSSSSGSAQVLSSSELDVASASSSSQCLTFVSSSCSTTTTTTTTASVSTSLQLSLSRVLPQPSTTDSLSSETSLIFTTAAQSSSSPETIPSIMFTPPSPSPPPEESSIPPSLITTALLASSTLTSSSTTTTTMTTTSSITPSTEESMLAVPPVVSDGSITTVTAAQTGTVVTSAYQGTVTTPAYDPHSYPYPPESYPSRPATPAWGSCNFYDGTQPNTNKYMEISPTKSSANQSIQCDENGKSYLELGSASPYTHTYTNECGNYTTSPSSYPPQSYNQTCTSPSNSSTYGQQNNYFNTRQSYSPNPYNVYPASDGYNNFEGENGCSYGYGTNGYAGTRGAMPPSRGPPRCMSPYCDPTRGTARPNCYHQQRLSVLNVSMYKLNRFRQFPEPSLHRSVLICNTLRHIERELEAEGVSVASLLAHSHAHNTNPHLQGAAPPNPGVQPCPEPMPSSPPPSPEPTEGPLPPMHAPLVGSPLAAPVSLPPSTPSTPPPPVSHYSTASPTVQYPTSQYLPTDHPTTFDGRETAHLRQYQSLPPDTPHDDTDCTQEAPSTEGDAEEESPPSPAIRPPSLPSEERTDAINWCSVLSLSSQTDLDSMNNNEYGDWGGESSTDMDYSRTDDGPPWKLPSLSADDVLKSFPEASKRLEPNEDLDSIINVLVGS